MKKLVLMVVDAMKPAMLEQAVAAGRAPAMQRIMQEGVYIDDVVASFPSVTPVCAATIATGVGPDEHHIPAMNWYHRYEERYVEYGSSFSASRQAGVIRSLTDTVYRMNAEHLSNDTPTVFESLDDMGLRTAGTTYLIYRGRHQHDVAQESPLARLVTSTLFRRTIFGPTELFYADLYASRKTGCRGALGMPGARDQHTGCVGSYLIERELFDFMLYSLPDNDSWSHRNGPEAQVVSLAAADRQIERLMHAAGGPTQFLEDYAVIITSDHSQVPVQDRIRLDVALSAFRIAGPSGGAGRGVGGVGRGVGGIGRGVGGVGRSNEAPELAVSPNSRAAMVYVLDPERRQQLLPHVVAAVEDLEGVDLLMWRSGAEGDPQEGVIRAPGGAELRFSPGSAVVDPRGVSWDLEGDLDVLAARIEDGRLLTPDYPDALTRVWSALLCENAGDLLLSAAPGYEFVDWGGSDHVGGGSHGSLHRSDSCGALITCGTGPVTRDQREVWTLRDVAPMVREHFTPDQ